MLVITVCATKSYVYAMRAQARRVVANFTATKGLGPGHVVLVGDLSSELKGIAELYRSILPAGWQIHLEGRKEFVEGGENYKVPAQMLIARMRTEAAAKAIQLGADFCWSLDSDVLPPVNALRCSLNTLEFDNGYYSVATCPYPNTAFLGGFGTRYHPIAEDFLPNERKIPSELKAEYDANEAELKGFNDRKEKPTEDGIV